jgi:hypothetical protein
MGKHLSRIANLDLQVSRESWVFRFIFWVSGFSLGCLDSVFLPVSAGCLDSLLDSVSSAPEPRTFHVRVTDNKSNQSHGPSEDSIASNQDTA